MLLTFPFMWSEREGDREENESGGREGTDESRWGRGPMGGERGIRLNNGEKYKKKTVYTCL